MKPDRDCTFAQYKTWVFINYLFGTGNRISTSLDVRISDVNFADGVIILRKVKNRKQQIIPLGKAWDIEKDAAYLDLSTDVFIDTYLKKDTSGMAYITKHKPCDFLMDDCECLLGDCKPESCGNYPYTNQPERLLSLLAFMENVKICPVAYEICEQLKREYNFRG